MVDFSYTMPTKELINPKNKSSKCNICTVNKINDKQINNCIKNVTFKQNEHKLSAEALLDSGASAGSYINADIAKWLVKHGALSIVEPKLVCSCFNECKYISNYIQTDINFDTYTSNVNNQTIKNFNCNLKFWIIDELPYDVIIGNNDIESNFEISKMFHTNFDFELTNRNTMHSKVHKKRKSTSIMSECDSTKGLQGPLDTPTLAEPVREIATGDSRLLETTSS